MGPKAQQSALTQLCCELKLQVDDRVPCLEVPGAHAYAMLVDANRLDWKHALQMLGALPSCSSLVPFVVSCPQGVARRGGVLDTFTANALINATGWHELRHNVEVCCIQSVALQCSAGDEACAKACRWQAALALLHQFPAQRLQKNVAAWLAAVRSSAQVQRSWLFFIAVSKVFCRGEFQCRTGPSSAICGVSASLHLNS